MKSLNTLSIILVFFLFTNCMDKTKQVSNNVNTDLKKIEDSLIKINNSIGVITLTDKYTQQDTVKIYNEDGSLWYKFTYFYDDSDGEFEYYNKNFNPLAFHPDYFLLALKVSQIEKNRYKVIVNENTELNKYIKKGESFLKFENWRKHVLDVYAVEFEAKENPLRKEPNEQANRIRYNSDNLYQPKKIKGNWLQVVWKEKQDKYSGWIKWKEDQELLIKILYLN